MGRRTGKSHQEVEAAPYVGSLDSSDQRRIRLAGTVGRRSGARRQHCSVRTCCVREK
jgi:hypothetical protein